MADRRSVSTIRAFRCTSSSVSRPPMLQPVVGSLHHFTHLREEEEEIQEGKMKVCKGVSVLSEAFQFYLV